MAGTDTDRLKTELATQPTDQSSPPSIMATLTSTAVQEQLTKALPAGVKPERFTRVLMTALRQTPAIAECTRESVLGAVFLSAQLGLEPGPFGHVYFMPRRDGKASREAGRTVKVCQWLLGYRGMIHLARNTGLIQTIYSEVVFKADEFDWHKGLHPKLEHRPVDPDRDDPGRLTAVYSAAHYLGGGFNFEVLTRPMVEARRDRSGTPTQGPWVTDTIHMWRKTGIRALYWVLPTSAETEPLHRAMQADEGVAIGDADGDVEVVEIEQDAS